MLKKVGIFIPARLGSSRLKNKMLKDINGKSLIIRTTECALFSNVGSVYVATDSEEIKDEVENYFKDNLNVQVVMVKEHCNSGSDRVYLALKKVNKVFDYIVNIQGDMPNLNKEDIINIVDILNKKQCDISTVVTPFKDRNLAENINDVKCVFEKNSQENMHRALYFTRNKAPFSSNGDNIFYKHLGIYGYTLSAIEKFFTFEKSYLESLESLEQLRALANGMSIFVSISSFSNTISVDTQEDLELAKQIIL